MSLIDDLRRQYGLNRKAARRLVKLSRQSETAYARALLEMVAKIRARVESSIVPNLPTVWNNDNWPALLDAVMSTARGGLAFEIATPFLVSTWARNVQIAAGNRWEQTLKNAFGIDVQALVRTQPQAPIVDAVQAAINTNVRKIKSIPAEYLDKVEDVITRSRNNGLTQAAAAKEIRAIYPVSKKKARLLARDQTEKLAETINRIQQEQAGVKSYRWRGQLDNRERKLHLSREGHIFQWSKPPSDGHPGQPINCRCHAQANFEESGTNDNKPPHSLRNVRRRTADSRRCFGCAA